VILTEIDFEEMDEITVRELFVCATRDTMKLVLIMSVRSAQHFMNLGIGRRAFYYKELPAPQQGTWHT
jgi:hypothetical protein